MTTLGEMRSGDAAFARFRTWLDLAALATSDLAEGNPRYFAAHDADGDPIAFAGLAGEGPDLLLRSVVVHADARQSGLGARLVAAISDEARAAGGAPLWLLTESAFPFFSRLKFMAAERSAAPPSITASSQFRGLCPALATLMCKPLHVATA